MGLWEADTAIEWRCPAGIRGGAGNLDVDFRKVNCENR
jgi:hypothetical protein